MSLKNYSFENKKVLVTGGAQGIGEAIVRMFYSENAIVYVIDISDEKLGKLKEELPKINIISLDLLDWKTTRETIEALGPLDHLVNNAGIFINKDIFSQTEEDYDKLFGINLKAVFNCCIAFANSIKNSGDNLDHRTIVNISSVVVQTIFENCGLYPCTKAGVHMLTRSLAIDLSPLSIRVNCVGPALVRTSLYDSIPAELKKKVEERVLSRVLIKKEIEADDIARTVLYLSSSLSDKITGQAHYVDCGIGTFG